MSSLYIIVGLGVYCLAYENIALHKPAHEAFPYVHDKVSPGNAVDGRKTDLRGLGGQCSLSDRNKTSATWWVNLTSILSIHHITIYYRTDNVPWGPSNGYSKRFLGFSVYVSNTTNRLDRDLCFKDSSFTISTIPAVFTTNCTKHGHYVIYHNERLSGTSYPADYSPYAYNDLCEVEVYGCPTPGFYGSDCTTPCPNTNCRYCHIVTGACQGCNPGYQGHRCELEMDPLMTILMNQRMNHDCICKMQIKPRHSLFKNISTEGPISKKGLLFLVCAKGFYGQDCILTCNDKCDGCNNVNGYCDSGCNPGWMGDNCQQPCYHGLYGQHCTQTCNDKCDGCNNVNGVCDRGCKPGWRGDYCQQPCSHGSYGQECTMTCNARCDGCNNVNGSCDKGCKPGWKGDNCQQPCPNGSYGQNCTLTCNDKCDGCNNVNGYCDRGCRPGWKGDNCQQACSKGFYGQECTLTCNVKCDGCNNVNGVCDRGCLPGWKGDNCQQPCTKGFYGHNCQQTCDDKCDGCNNVDGSCDRGCLPGWKGDNCQQPCSYGFYGLNCTLTCDEKCTGCNNVNGYCDRGCPPGWEGGNCQQQCQGNKYGLNCSKMCGNCRDLSQCHYINGSCLNGCDPGFQGEKCNMECDFGFYGNGCLQECGSFCKTSRDCHHVTGFCKNGCKSGWQGNDCFEVSKHEDSYTDWKSRFYGMLGAFCVSLILIGLLIAYHIIYIQKKKTHFKQYQHSERAKKAQSQYCETQPSETADGGYQELGDFNVIPTTYQNLQIQ
ncbi:uncharacterized protein LOC111111957 isoform X2 [Crassostrea virginica]